MNNLIMLVEMEKLILCLLFVKVCRTIEERPRINILLWTSHLHEPFSSFEPENKTFTQRNCLFQNCFVTFNKSSVRDVHKFDVVLFNAADIPLNFINFRFPKARSVNQLYILASTLLPAISLIGPGYDHIFNLTWSYRLESDIVWPTIVIKDSRGKVKGPERGMKWVFPQTMKKAPEHVRKKIKHKKEAAMILAPRCSQTSLRDKYVRDLIYALAEFGFSVDTYHACYEQTDEQCFVLLEKGLEDIKCKDSGCPDHRDAEKCEIAVQSKYYFYLLFEDVISEDFISIGLLNAIQEITVPVVIGGTNFTRFMPEGAYINATGVTPMLLADELAYRIRHKQAYTDMFEWRNYYSYHAPEESPETDPFCKFCEYLNDREDLMQPSLRTEKYSWFSNYSNVSNLYKFDTFYTTIVNLKNFHFTLNSNICKYANNIPVIAVIITAVHHTTRRQTIRETWGYHEPNTDYLYTVFMVGESLHASENNRILEEHEAHGDIIQGSFLDTYRNLTYKHIMALYWVTNYCPRAKYILKTDDDVFVNIPVLKRLLSDLQENDLITCVVHYNSPVIRRLKSKYYVPKTEYSEEKYPIHCDGPLVIYNPKVAPLLVEAAKTEPFFFLEDVYVTGKLSKNLGLQNNFNDIWKLRLHSMNNEYLRIQAERRQSSFLFGCGFDEWDIRWLWDITNGNTDVEYQEEPSTEFHDTRTNIDSCDGRMH